MTTDHQIRVAAWIRCNLKERGLSIAALARALVDNGIAGMIPSKISHGLAYRRQFTALEIEKMEKIFSSNFRSGEGDASAVASASKSRKIVFIGETIAFGFREQLAMHHAQPTEIAPNSLPQYIDVPQEAWPVADDSANLYVQPGDFVLVVDYWDFRSAITIGDKIVIKRYHPILFAQGDTSQAENSIRLVARDGESIVLRSLSSNPAIRDIVYNQDDKSVEIRKLIIGGQFYERY